MNRETIDAVTKRISEFVGTMTDEEKGELADIVNRPEALRELVSRYVEESPLNMSAALSLVMSSAGMEGRMVDVLTTALEIMLCERPAARRKVGSLLSNDAHCRAAASSVGKISIIAPESMVGDPFVRLAPFFGLMLSGLEDNPQRLMVLIRLAATMVASDIAEGRIKEQDARGILHKGFDAELDSALEAMRDGESDHKGNGAGEAVGGGGDLKVGSGKDGAVTPDC